MINASKYRQKMHYFQINNVQKEETNSWRHNLHKYFCYLIVLINQK